MVVLLLTIISAVVNINQCRCAAYILGKCSVDYTRLHCHIRWVGCGLYTFLYLAMLMYCGNVRPVVLQIKQSVVPFEVVCALWYLRKQWH